MFNGFIAGVIGASLGVSVGVVLVPLWLRSGVDRDIVVNSTAPLLFIESSVAFLISFLHNLYDSFLYVFLFFLSSFIATFYIKTPTLFRENIILGNDILPKAACLRTRHRSIITAILV